MTETKQDKPLEETLNNCCKMHAWFKKPPLRRIAEYLLVPGSTMFQWSDYIKNHSFRSGDELPFLLDVVMEGIKLTAYANLIYYTASRIM